MRTLAGIPVGLPALTRAAKLTRRAGRVGFDWPDAAAVLDKLEEVLGITAGHTTPDGVFTLNATRCLGACGLAPVMMINEDVYGRLTPDQIPEIIAKYRS